MIGSNKLFCLFTCLFCYNRYLLTGTLSTCFQMTKSTKGQRSLIGQGNDSLHSSQVCRYTYVQQNKQKSIYKTSKMYRVAIRHRHVTIYFDISTIAIMNDTSQNGTFSRASGLLLKRLAKYCRRLGKAEIRKEGLCLAVDQHKHIIIINPYGCPAFPGREIHDVVV